MLAQRAKRGEDRSLIPTDSEKGNPPDAPTQALKPRGHSKKRDCRQEAGDGETTHVFLGDIERKALPRGQRDHVHVAVLAEHLERPLAAGHGCHDVVRLESLAPGGLRFRKNTSRALRNAEVLEGISG